MKKLNFPRAACRTERAGRQAALQDGPVGCTLRRTLGLHIKLGCGKGRARALLFSAACPALFRSPSARPSVFCAACQPDENSRFSFGNTALQPAGPPISVILPTLEAQTFDFWINPALEEQPYAGGTYPTPGGTDAADPYSPTALNKCMSLIKWTNACP